MKNILDKYLKIFDKVLVCVWLILGLVLASVLVVPFANRAISFGSFRMPVTPVIVLFPILLGIFYAILESDENPKKVTPERKKRKRLIKAIVFPAVYIITIAAAIHGLR